MPKHKRFRLTRDLIHHRFAPRLFWVFPVVSIILASSFDLSNRWTGGVWTIAIAIMGGGCVANARRCGRVHCHITGPFFLVISGIALLHVIGVLDVSKVNWAVAGWTVGVLAVTLTVIPEMILREIRESEELLINTSPPRVEERLNPQDSITKQFKLVPTDNKTLDNLVQLL